MRSFISPLSLKIFNNVFSSSGYKWSNMEAGFDFFKYGNFEGFFFWFLQLICNRNHILLHPVTILVASGMKSVFYEVAW